METKIPGNNWKDLPFEELEEFLKQPEIKNQIIEFFSWGVEPKILESNPTFKTYAGKIVLSKMREAFSLGVILSDRVKTAVLGPPGVKKDG